MAYINFIGAGSRMGEGKCGLKTSTGFWKGFHIVKARKSFTCRNCGKERASGTRYFGEPYWFYGKICMFCFNDWFKESKKFLSEVEEHINNNKEALHKNEAVWLKEAMVGTLKGAK
jgi:hypothetical protein